MAPKLSKEEAPDIESTRSQFITKLTATADAMRKFSNFADALAKVASKVPLDDPEMVESLQAVIDATPSVSRKRKLADLSEDGGKKKKREKKVKDPNAPKAPPSAYIMFQNDVRNRVRAEHPGVQYKELMGLISKQWNALPQDKKQPYFDRVNDAKKSHEVDMARYIAEHPGLEGSSSKKAKKAAVPVESVENAPMQVVRKFTPVATPAIAHHGESSDSASEEGSSSDDEGKPANGKPSDDDEEDDNDSGSDEQSVPPPKAATPPPAKKMKKSDKSERRK